MYGRPSNQIVIDSAQKGLKNSCWQSESSNSRGDICFWRPQPLIIIEHSPHMCDRGKNIEIEKESVRATKVADNRALAEI